LELSALRLRSCLQDGAAIERRITEEAQMDSNFVGLAAVVMSLGIPMAAMYTFFRVRRLRSEERLAAIARGVDVPMQPELSEAARSRRSGILLVAGAIGYIITFVLIGRTEPDAITAATFGVIPLAVGLGFFVDHALIRRDARAH
jgi:preprotein translocase subunit Sss1